MLMTNLDYAWDTDRPDNAALETVVRYLTPGRAAMLRELHPTNHAELPQAPEPLIEAAYKETIDREGTPVDSYELHLRLLTEWALIEEAGTISDGGERNQRYELTDRGEQLFSEFGPDIGSEAIARDDRDATDWLVYPAPAELKLVEVVGAVTELQQDQKGSNTTEEKLIDPDK